MQKRKRNRSHSTWHLLGKYTFIVICSLQVIIGLLWLAKNLPHIPGYGDTREYIDISKTLTTRTLRVIGYPLVIRMASRISVHYFSVSVYLFQITMFGVAILYFLHTLLNYLDRKKLRKIQDSISFSWYLMFVLIITTNPILLHFHLSIMTDSLALSFGLLFLTALFSLLYGSSSLVFPTVMFISSFFCLSLIRAEKRYFGLAVFSVTLLIWLWQHRAKPTFLPALKRAGILVLLVGLVITLIISINRKTQTQEAFSSGIPPFPHPQLMAFRQFTWRHLADIYSRLSDDDIKQLISYQDAVTYDEMPRLQGRFIWKKIAITFALSEYSLKILKEKGLPDELLKNLQRLEHQKFIGTNTFLDSLEEQVGRKLSAKYEQLILKYAERSATPRPVINTTLNTITMTALPHYWSEVALRVGTRFLQYLFSPFTFSYELITNGSGGFRVWTIKNMAMYSPSLTNIFLYVGIGVLIVQTVLLVVFHRTLIKRLVFPFMILFLGSIINSASFSLVMPRTWHVRYSLISYVTILLFLLSANMLGFFTTSRKDDDEIQPH